MLPVVTRLSALSSAFGVLQAIALAGGLEDLTTVRQPVERSLGVTDGLFGLLNRLLTFTHISSKLLDTFANCLLTQFVLRQPSLEDANGFIPPVKSLSFKCMALAFASRAMQSTT